MANLDKDGYIPSEVEEKWQRLWEERGTNTHTREGLKSAKDPFYNLMMFPYPLLRGLHVGTFMHSREPTCMGDISAFAVRVCFEPMGFLTRSVSTLRTSR